MKYYMLESYNEIPQYAEVEYLGEIIDAGYDCKLVKYNGVDYKPYANQVISEKDIGDKYRVYLDEYLKWDLIREKTILSKI